MSGKRKFIVMRAIKKARFFVHYSAEKALAEAERLAEKHDDKFYVYEIIGKATKAKRCRHCQEPVTADEIDPFNYNWKYL